MHRRIVSLLPSATEALFAMGAGDRVVAISHACDPPPSGAPLPRVTRTHVDPTASGGSIDEQVRGRLDAGKPLYEVDQGVLHHVQPDLIITQDTCTVCATGPQEVHAALAYIEPVDKPEVLTLHAHTLDGVFEDLATLQEIAGDTPEGQGFVADLQDRVDRVREATQGAGERPGTLVLDWLDPPMVAGHWVPEMVEAAGGQALLAAPGEPSRYVDWEQMLESGPDALVLAPCGFALDRARKEAAGLVEREGWDTLPAVQAGRVHAADGEHLFSRPGPRLVDALEHLAAALHPQHCGHLAPAAGDRWAPLA